MGKRLVSINMGNYSSTGKIMYGISELAQEVGFKTWCCYPNIRLNLARRENDIIIGSCFWRKVYGRLGKWTGFQNIYSCIPTFFFLRKIKRIHPDIIHLHNLHASWIHLGMLFNFIKKHNIPVVWTLHDCWAFTGRCPYFDLVNCDKWKTGCHDCPYPKKEYPAALIDRTSIMWRMKKKWFTGVRNMTIVTPSQWLAGLVSQSFLKDYPAQVIHNGINLEVFKPSVNSFRAKYALQNKFILLGVAFGWGKRKGLDIFAELARRLPSNYQIVLIGTDDAVDKNLPSNIISIHRTNNQAELAAIYSTADLFVNPTREEVLGMVNLESLACGTPIAAFGTGGVPETLDSTCGVAVPTDDIDQLESQIRSICEAKPFSSDTCVKRAGLFNEKDKYQDYIALYRNKHDGGGVITEYISKYNLCGKFVLLGVAFGWGRRKGLDVFVELSKRLPADYQIILVGTDDRVDKTLPQNIISIHRTNNQAELAEIYSSADLFVNPTREENYPTVNMEALACGTPVLTFDTGGSPEIIDDVCGDVVPVDDIDTLVSRIQEIRSSHEYSSIGCLKRSESFDEQSRYKEYLKLYQRILEVKSQS